MNILKPFKNLSIRTTSVTGHEYWPEPLGENDPWWAGGTQPRFYQWKATFNLPSKQLHSYPYSTVPFEYSLLDVNVGDFVSSGEIGKVYKIVSIEKKTEQNMTCIIEDVYRLITFKYQQGDAQPSNFTYYVCFSVDGNYQTSIDPFYLNPLIKIDSISYIPSYLKQIDFMKNPIFKCQCEFEVGESVAIEKGVGFVRPIGDLNRNIVGKVLGTTGLTNEYIVQPITQHEEIPTDVGEPGDVIYLNQDGETLTTNITRKPLYLKTYNAIPNISRSNSDVVSPIINAGSSIELNGEIITFTNQTTMSEFVDLMNQSNNGITANEVFPPYTIVNDNTKLSYGLIGVTQIPTVIEIDGTNVTIETTTAGQEQYGSMVAIGPDIVTDINNANVPNIRAAFNPTTSRLSLINESGGDILISNISGDTFASDSGNSSTGFSETNISPKDQTIVEMVVENGQEIVIRNITGNFTGTTGISGSDNGRRAMGIYYGGKVREGTNYVVDTMNDVDNLSPFIGDGVHVLDSANGEWVEMKYTATGWVTIATEDSARTDADTLSLVVSNTDFGQLYIGTVSQNSRISNISVIVNEAFDDANITVNIGDAINNDALISDSFIDLLNTGTYTNTPSNVYDTETDIYAFVGNHTSTTGNLKIVISYT